MQTNLVKPLSLQDAIAQAPAIATREPHPWKSDRYSMIPTIDIIEGMLDNGFAIRSVQQAKGRIGNGGVNTALYNQHVIRMRDLKAFNDVSVGDSIPEIVLINSHDGTGSFMMTAGLFRLVCSNGMVVGDSYESLRFDHRYLDMEDLMETAKKIWDHVPQIAAWRQKALERPMDDMERNRFANHAQLIRFPTREKMPFEAGRLLEARRTEDTGNDLWHTYQRVQENLIRGGIEGRSANNRITHMREIKGVQADIDINRSLWDLANTFLEAA